jgi:hypothetical protein
MGFSGSGGLGGASMEKNGAARDNATVIENKNYELTVI